MNCCIPAYENEEKFSNSKQKKVPCMKNEMYH